MTFAEKSSITMTAALVAVLGGYAVAVGRAVAGTPVDQVAWHGALAWAVLVLVVVAVVAHVLLAAGEDPAALRGALPPEVRTRGLRAGKAVLAAASLAALALAVLEAPTFWIAQTLVAGLAGAEIATGLAVAAATHRTRRAAASRHGALRVDLHRLQERRRGVW